MLILIALFYNIKCCFCCFYCFVSCVTVYVLLPAKDQTTIYKLWIVSANQYNVLNKFNGVHTSQSSNHKNDDLL